MQVVTDFIYATIVAGVILLIVFSLKFRGDSTSIDAVQYRAAKIGTLSLAEAVERDFTNMGSQHPNFPPPPAHLAPGGWDTLGVPAHIVFWTQTDSLQAAQRVCYSWIEMPTKTVELKRGTVPLMEVRRMVGTDDDCNGGALAGMNTNMITRFEIHIRDASGNEPEEIYGDDLPLPLSFLVRLRAVSPLGPSDSIEETRWEKLFRPVNIWERRKS